VHPLGFSTASRHMKRAGLDYWQDVTVEEVEEITLNDSFFFFSSKATQNYTEAPFREDSLLIFGSETSGLPEEFHEKWPERFYKIPMIPGARCLNLANSANIILYEALRQTHFSFGLNNDKRKERTALTSSADVSGT
jgi:tRNA (cytidine/uridine-2'-O-)-methyltransferase